MFYSHIEINKFLKHSNYYSGNALINNPKPIENQEEPECIYYNKYYEYNGDENSNEIEYSIVMPIHNQENIIVKNITSVLVNTVGKFEFIIILDGCEDKTEENVINFFKNIENKIKKECKLQNVIIIKQSTSVFETVSDNIGFRLSSGKYIVEVQADMKIITYAYNKILSIPMELWDDVIAVSGRCCHTLPYRKFEGVGKTGDKVEEPVNFPTFDFMNKFFIMETVNRGPLCLDAEKLKVMGYLDETNFYLADDDHDLMARAFYQKKWVCGYFPIEFNSPIADGSQRKQSNEKNNKIREIKKQNCTGGFLRSLGNIYKPKDIEVRDIESVYNKFISH